MVVDVGIILLICSQMLCWNESVERRRKIYSYIAIV